ncbi:hypothetical protein [Flavobacterium sp.]|nr:hypothetical protein [Flavobacterium sp.]
MRQVLAKIIGLGTTQSQVVDNGIHYNVKRLEIVDFSFKQYYIDTNN